MLGSFLVVALVLTVLAVIAYTLAYLTLLTIYTIKACWRWSRDNKAKVIFLPIWIAYLTIRWQYRRIRRNRYSLQIKTFYGWRSMRYFRTKKQAVKYMRKIKHGKPGRVSSHYTSMIVLGQRYRLVTL